MRIAINFGLYQLGWFACVFGGANGLPWFGVLVVALVGAYHLNRAAEPTAELVLMLLAGLIGLVWDSALVAMGWLVYPSGTLVAGTAPYWIVALWVGFATSLNVSLRWLKGRSLLASALGAIAGPLAYLGGAKLGGVGFENAFAGLAALAIGWAVIMPLLVTLSNRYDGFRDPDSKAVSSVAVPQLSTEHV
jgi:hypothetical protein